MKVKKPGQLIKIVVVVLAIAAFLYWNEWRFERVNILAGRNVDYLDDYRDYYSKTVYKPNTGASVWGADRQIIYFLSGQKEKMLDKIKEDVTDILETLIEEHGDIFYNYDISNDFKFVNIYVASGYIDERSHSGIDPKIVSRICSLISLHYTIKDDRNTGLGRMVRYIEPDG